MVFYCFKQIAMVINDVKQNALSISTMNNFGFVSFEDFKLQLNNFDLNLKLLKFNIKVTKCKCQTSTL